MLLCLGWASWARTGARTCSPCFKPMPKIANPRAALFLRAGRLAASGRATGQCFSREWRGQKGSGSATLTVCSFSGSTGGDLALRDIEQPVRKSRHPTNGFFAAKGPHGGVRGDRDGFGAIQLTDPEILARTPKSAVDFHRPPARGRPACPPARIDRRPQPDAGIEGAKNTS